MATKPLVPVEEYLRMSFDGPDPEYPDGELAETHLGEYEHGAAQARLCAAWGIKQISLADPASRTFSVYDEAGLREVPALDLPEFGLIIQKSDTFE